VKRWLIMGMLAIVPAASWGQSASTLPTVDDKINFSAVVPVEGATKDELYARTKLWFANAFTSANDVIQLDDPERGIVLGKGSVERAEGGAYPRGEPSVVKTWRFTIWARARWNAPKAAPTLGASRAWSRPGASRSRFS
jgi:hypothetical protein